MKKESAKNPRPGKKLTLLIFILLQIFILGILLQNIFSFLPSVNRLIGIAVIGLCALILLRLRPRLPAEIWLLGAFLGWAVLSGLLVAVDQGSFLLYVKLLVQIWPLAFVLVGIVVLRRNADIIFIALLAGVLLLVVYSLLSGDYGIALDRESTQRVSAFLSNPNDFGFYAFLGIVATLYFWDQYKDKWIRLAMVGLVLVLAISIVSSGSRKAFLGMLFFGAAWLWFCYRRQAFRNAGTVVLITLVLGGAYGLTQYAYENTALGTRLAQSLDNPDIDPKRMELYREGWDMFMAHPIAGVGLGNFPYYSEIGTYSHSDYMETLATTGIIGFILYFLVYVVLWMRIDRTKRVIRDKSILYRLGLFQAFIAALLFMAVSRINFLSIPTWIAFAGAIGYIYSASNVFVPKSRSVNVVNSLASSLENQNE